jgi:hypothetical protein
MVSSRVETDLAHGGRWTSLRLGGREWLWSHGEPRRADVVPGDAFADAGGLEECVPTVRGTPDHGAAWTRAWRHVDGWDVVDCGDFVLHRRMHTSEAAVTAAYRLTASAGFRFVWAAHALLDVSPRAGLALSPGTAVRVYPGTDAAYVGDVWPTAFRLDRLGPDDGTALGAVAVGARTARVVDDDDHLELSLHAGADVPVSVAIWRNLGGFPTEAPYRSIGVEPMLGSVFELAEATAGDAVTVPPSGVVDWQLEITAGRTAA